jgi:hypothetical protein
VEDFVRRRTGGPLGEGVSVLGIFLEDKREKNVFRKKIMAYVHIYT